MLSAIRFFVCIHVLTPCLATRANGFCLITCVTDMNVIDKTLVPCFVASSTKKCTVEVLKKI